MDEKLKEELVNMASHPFILVHIIGMLPYPKNTLPKALEVAIAGALFS